jgi:hypothetical protein
MNQRKKRSSKQKILMFKPENEGVSDCHSKNDANLHQKLESVFDDMLTLCMG